MSASAVRRYKFIEHTADVGVEGYGATLAQAFAGAACGLFAIISEPATVRETEAREIKLSEANLEDLLFEWLGRLIYLFDTEKLLFRRFEVVLVGEGGLEATCYGESYDPSRHHLKRGVKAVTYHQLRVDRRQNRVQVIFDI